MTEESRNASRLTRTPGGAHNVRSLQGRERRFVGESIAGTPEESYRCLMRTEIDHLALANCVLDKREQPAYIHADRRRYQFTLN